MKSVPWYVIILVCILFGILLELVIFRDEIFTPTKLPAPLPSPPTPVETILGISIGDFFQANSWIRTVDGEMYSYYWDGERYILFPEVSLPETMRGDPCGRAVLWLIERSAGEIKECQTAQALGEWCPGQIVSVALTEDGDLWQYEKNLPCVFIFTLLLPFFGSAGFALGVVLVLARGAFKFLKRRRLT